MTKRFTLLLLSMTFVLNYGLAQTWEIAYNQPWDTRDLRVINDTLYFTRNVPTGATTYVNYLYRSVVPGVILDSSKTIDGIYGSYDYSRHNGNEYISIYAPFAGTNGFYKKNQANGMWIRKNSKGNYLLDKQNHKIYVGASSSNIVVSSDAGETFTPYWATSGSISLVGFDKENNLYISLKISKSDSTGLWKVSNNGQTKTQVWSQGYTISPYTNSLIHGNDKRLYIIDENSNVAYSENGGSSWTVVNIPSSTLNYGGYFTSSLHQLENGELLISIATYSGGSGRTELVYKAKSNLSDLSLYSDGLPQSTQSFSLTYWKGYVYVRTLNGMYRTKVDDGDYTSIANVSKNSLNLNLYPNPASDVLLISSAASIVGESYAIVDYTGKIVDHGVVDSDIFELQLTNLKAGLYFLKVGENTFKSFVISE
ncbi:MAG: T9SS type A sorting domain-containing protein [Sporocytophaga sp.]|nr:T9SS type A sorting domain-containing protein [Sporocytophaga sp.]